MDSDHRRKRKRIAKPLFFHSYSLLPHYFSARSLISCFTFVALLYSFSDRIPVNPSAFRPILVVPTFPLLSSSSNHSIRLHPNGELSSQSPLKIEDQVLFPDHALLIVSKKDARVMKGDELQCGYCETPSSRLKRNVFSVDEHNEFQSIVRCPLPPANCSSAIVSLEKRGREGTDLSDGNRTVMVHSWETVAYAAALDGKTAVVFVKGLNLRPDRKSDPAQFSCHFGLGKWNNRERRFRFTFTTRAVTAAQEVVRCLLPRTLRLNPGKAEGIRVTLGLIDPHLHARRTRDRLLLPSVAKIFSSEGWKKKKKENRKDKYELCVCTMVWNQASALREWIMYHAWLGVERWFIYDNNSDDEIKKVIEELELEEYNVSRHVWPWIKTQEAGFSHCALRARDECNWVGFMDVDEFFYFPFRRTKQRSKKPPFFPLQNSLKTLVSKFTPLTTIGEIRTACYSFGPSGLSSPPSQGVTVGYTCRLQSPERHKSIVRPDALDITLLNVVHHFHLRKGFGYLNLAQSRAVINHYKYQVWESFRAKFYRRVATYVADWQENQNEGSRDRAPGLGTEPIEPPNWHLQFCEVWDTRLRDFVLGNLADPATGLLPWERTSV